MQAERPETEAAEAILSGQAVTKQWLTEPAKQALFKSMDWRQCASTYTGGKPHFYYRRAVDREEWIKWDRERGQWCHEVKLIPSYEPFCYGCRAWHPKGKHLAEPDPFPVGWQMDNAPIERLIARFMVMRNLLIDAMRELPRESALRGPNTAHTLFAQHMESFNAAQFDADLAESDE